MLSTCICIEELLQVIRGSLMRLTVVSVTSQTVSCEKALFAEKLRGQRPLMWFVCFCYPFILIYCINELLIAFFYSRSRGFMKEWLTVGLAQPVITWYQLVMWCRASTPESFDEVYLELKAAALLPCCLLTWSVKHHFLMKASSKNMC